MNIYLSYSGSNSIHNVLILSPFRSKPYITLEGRFERFGKERLKTFSDGHGTERQRERFKNERITVSSRSIPKSIGNFQNEDISQTIQFNFEKDSVENFMKNKLKVYGKIHCRYFLLVILGLDSIMVPEFLYDSLPAIEDHPGRWIIMAV